MTRTNVTPDIASILNMYVFISMLFLFLFVILLAFDRADYRSPTISDEASCDKLAISSQNFLVSFSIFNHPTDIVGSFGHNLNKQVDGREEKTTIHHFDEVRNFQQTIENYFNIPIKRQSLMVCENGNTCKER